MAGDGGELLGEPGLRLRLCALGSLAGDADTTTMADVPDDGLLPGDHVRLLGPIFEDWLGSDDAAALAL